MPLPFPEPDSAGYGTALVGLPHRSEVLFSLPSGGGHARLYRVHVGSGRCDVLRRAAGLLRDGVVALDIASWSVARTVRMPAVDPAVDEGAQQTLVCSFAHGVARRLGPDLFLQPGTLPLPQGLFPVGAGDVVYSMPLAWPVDLAAGRKGQAEPRVTAFSLRGWMQTARGPRIGPFTRLWGGQLRALVGLDEAGRLVGHTQEDLVLIDPATLRPIARQHTGGAIEAIARVGGSSVAILPAQRVSS